MTKPGPTNNTQAFKATVEVENRVGAFFYKATQLILSQPFKYPLESDAFRIWDSPLGQQLVSLVLSDLPLSADGKAVPKEVVAIVAKEAAEKLKTELSKPIDPDTVFTLLSPEMQEYCKGEGLLEQMLEGFRLFLDAVASQLHVPASDVPPVSLQERSMVMSYLVIGFFVMSVTAVGASYGGEERSRIQALQQPEYEALVEHVTARYGWGGDTNKAVELLRNGLGPELERKRRRKGLRIPGARYKGAESWSEPHNDEIAAMIVGLYEGLSWAANRGLLHILPDVPTGKLRNSLKLAAMHNLIDEIRKHNKQLGIGILPDWLQKGVTSDEIEIQTQTPKEVLDHEILTPEGELSSLLEKVADEAGFRDWADKEAEEERCADFWGKIEPLLEQLTPRQRLVFLSFRDGKRDEEIAVELKERFGKKVGVTQVRKLRHEARKQLKRITQK
jgi:DNA-directed RNA polymerase specialized sigma24 family protein